jgi:hypothetical protein
VARLALAGDAVAKRRLPADPDPPALGRRDLVADALARDLSLELRKRQEHVERQASH